MGSVGENDARAREGRGLVICLMIRRLGQSMHPINNVHAQRSIEIVRACQWRSIQSITALSAPFWLRPRSIEIDRRVCVSRMLLRWGLLRALARPAPAGIASVGSVASGDDAADQRPPPQKTTLRLSPLQLHRPSID